MADQREVIDIAALLVRGYRGKWVDRYGQNGKAAGAVALCLSLGSGLLAPGAWLSARRARGVDTSSYAAQLGRPHP